MNEYETLIYLLGAFCHSNNFFFFFPYISHNAKFVSQKHKTSLQVKMFLANRILFWGISEKNHTDTLHSDIWCSIIWDAKSNVGFLKLPTVSHCKYHFFYLIKHCSNCVASCYFEQKQVSILLYTENTVRMALEEMSTTLKFLPFLTPPVKRLILSTSWSNWTVSDIWNTELSLHVEIPVIQHMKMRKQWNNEKIAHLLAGLFILEQNKLFSKHEA